MTAGRLWAALLVFAAALALYASNAAPGLLWADGGELQAAAITGGIPHATGYPAFVLLGQAVARLGGSHPAYALNLMSSALAALGLFLIVLLLGELGVGVAASAGAALVFGLTYSPWHIALRAEVYTLAVVLALLALGCALVALRTGRFRLALLAAFLLGLTVVGHLAFAPPVAVAGLSLAWRELRRGRPAVLRLLLLAVAFALGFTPYLQTVAADARHAEVNYFELIRQVHNPLGRPMPDFDTIGKRIFWLLTAHNQYPRIPVNLSPRTVVVGSIEAACVLFFFELGPVALPLAVAGAIRQWRRARARAVGLLLGVTASALFCAAVSTGPMMHLFLLPAMLLLALLVGAGIESLMDALGGRSTVRRMVVAAAAVALVVVPGNPLRIFADQHPLTRWRFQAVAEGNERDRDWIPSLKHDDEPERYGRRAIELLPRDAMVMADWAVLTVLRYHQTVERARRDLRIEPINWSAAPDQMRAWQRSHDVARAPFVFTLRPPDSTFVAAIGESLEVIPGYWLFVQRTPVAGAPPPSRAR